ncbi:response regulator transcription factor [Puteibacter caeruleilacunae]|nr:response regulator transcription factor [Puteibacter caeruleilacunae]
MTIRCLIVDDEPLAIKVIRSYIDELGGFEIVAECKNAIEANNVLLSTCVDLIFLDINMPKISGVEFLKTLNNPPKTIFTTAHKEYALDGFDLDVVDYLMKPISMERFLRAINRYHRLSNASPGVPVQSPVTQPMDNDFIYVKGNRKMVKLVLSDVVLIEGLNEYVKIHLTDKYVVSKMSLSSLQDKLPSKRFIRIHRSFIVALDKIEAFSAANVEIVGKCYPIGRNYKESVMKALDFNQIES